MVFSSYVFIFGFLPITMLGFWFISRFFDHRWAKIWLCLASLVFYGWWDTRWVPVLLVSIAFNYAIAQVIIRRVEQEKEVKWLMLAGVGANLAALVYYKYLLWLLTLVGMAQVAPEQHGLPLGISFFTFLQIAFLADISQGFKEKYTPVNYFLFVTFFPHLIAGPIVHHRDLMPQFEEERNYRFQPREFAIGLAIFAIGLAKKTLIADNLAETADRLLAGGSTSAGTAWVGALAYSMQLYFDFSGYSDMAIGLARLLGIKFPINFDSPYKATSIIDFWQRWHITLTRFLTAYLYNPIALALVRRRAAAGRSTSKRASQTPGGFLELIALPTIVTMFIAGVWHGAGLQFVIFGLLHGIYITTNHAWRTFGPKRAAEASLVRTLGYGLLVYVCVLVAQIFFRATSAGEAWAVISHMTLLQGTDAAGAADIRKLDLLRLATAMLIVWFTPNTQQLMASFDPVLDLGRRIERGIVAVSLTLPWAAYLGGILFLGLYGIVRGQPFIYFQF